MKVHQISNANEKKRGEVASSVAKTLSKFYHALFKLWILIPIEISNNSIGFPYSLYSCVSHYSHLQV